MRWWFGLVLSFLLTAPSLAHSDLAAAEAAFREGDWRNAARLGREAGSAAGYALAARAHLVRAGLEAESREETGAALETAIRRADRAVSLDPDAAAGHIQAAAAYGFRAQRTRSMEDVRRAKTHIDRAVELAPKNPYARAGLGYWHGRTVLGAGSFLAELFFGARRSAAIEAFERALALDSDNLVIRVGFGRFLLRFGEDALTRRGLAELAKARNLTPRSALERELARQARRLCAAATGGAGAETLAERAAALAAFSPG